VSTGGPDLFVICKSCGSEVSPYITECPYCGNRLRKRAPKLDREQRVAERRARRGAPPLLTRLRRDEIPGIRPDRRPYATLALVLAGMIGSLLYRTGLGGPDKLAIIGKPGADWWRLFTAAFTYDNTGYALIALGALGVFGWLLERRHGPLAVIVLFAIGAFGGLAATAAGYAEPFAMGANGAALAFVIAWAIPDAIELRRTGEVEGDLIGAAAIGAAVALMPAALPEASWIADAVGALAGLAIGLPLARLSAR
jgi:membrane associated rhomboid family serine protease